MKKTTVALFISVFLVTAISSALSLEPGIWKTKTGFKLNGIPMPSNEKENCVTAEQAKDAKKTISDDLKKDGCELTKWNVVKNKLEASLTCKNKDVEATGDLHGTFSKKRYSLEGDAKGTYKNAIPSVATMKLTGEWVKICK